MKRNSKKQLFGRVLAALMISCMVLPWAAGCKSNGGDGAATDPIGSGEAGTSYAESIGLPKRDLGGADFVIRYHTGGSLGPAPLNVSRLEATKDILSEARYYADLAFEEAANVEISYMPANTDPNRGSDLTALRNMQTSGDIADVDMVMVGMRTIGGLVNDKFFMDLLEYDNYIHPDRTYYNSNMTEALSIGNKKFVAGGYYTYKNVFHTQVTLVNNTILSSLYGSNDKIDELYDKVFDKAWTLEALLECGEDFATGKVNDDPTQDKYTYILSRNGAGSMFFSTGGLVVDKDDSGTPVLTLDQAFNVTLLDYLQNQLGKNLAVRFTPNDGEVDEFSAGQGLFLQQGIGYVKEVKDSTGIDVRILPTPVCAEGNDYVSYLGAWTGNVAGIPASVADADIASYCYELYMAISYKYMYPSIYEKQFGTQYVANDVEARIFDLVVNSATFDMAECYGWEIVNYPCLRDIVYNELPVSSTVETISNAVKSGIATFLETYPIGS